jgi:squalene-hopene/tetraprenyl-beta-curcumene cyclase
MSAAASTGDSEQALHQAAARAASHLASLRCSEGLWPNLLTGGPYLDVLYALGAWFLGRKDHPLQPPHGEAWARRVLSSQNPDGGFPLWHGGPSDSRYGIETYLALRLAGLPASEPGLRALGRSIAKAGGLKEAGAVAWTKLLWAGAANDRSKGAGAPEHYYFLDYSRWPAITRQELACLASLSIAAYLRGASVAPPAANSPRLEEELPPPQEPEASFELGSITGRLISQWARVAPRPLRGPIVFRAYDAMVAEALRWPVLPVALYAALAVQAARGRGSKAIEQFERVISMLGPEEPSGPARPSDWGIRFTALGLIALAGMDGTGGLDITANALLERFRPSAPVSENGTPRAGWALGDLYPAPDAETTAWVILALQRAGVAAADSPVVREAAAALAAAQGKDGGWGADSPGASSPDVTGAAVEALAASGVPDAADSIRRAAQFLEQSQHAEAWWRGSRGVCRLYGTAMALRGLRAAGVDEREACVLRAGEWLRSIQNADGGWGEDPRSLDQDAFQEAVSTPAHTAWALLGLIAGGDAASESVRRGFAWLAGHQNADGAWDPVSPAMPGVAYAPYLMDPLGSLVWPLLAIRERLGSAATP